MWPASDRFRTTLAASHDVAARVDILAGGQPAATIDGAASDPVLVGGSVTVERATVRRRAEITLADVSGALTPSDAESLLVPLRGEVRLWRGVRLADATTADRIAGTDVELVPVGTFVVVDLDLDYPTVRISGYDRMWIPANSRLAAPFVVESGTNLGTALRQLLTQAIPTDKLQLNLPSTEETSGVLVFDEQSPPADAAVALATAAGWTLYADPMGVITAAPEADVTAESTVATYESGAGTMLLKARRQLSGQGIYNAVVATGEDPALPTPVYGYAEDTDPGSTTYAAAVGRYPKFWSSPLLRSDAQAVAAARTILAREGGIADTVAVSALPDPTLEAGDVLRVDDGRGITRLLQADYFNVPLGAAAQEVNCRATVLR